MIRRNAPLIGACAVIAGAAAFFVTARLPRLYESSVSIRVDPRGRLLSISASDVASENAMATELEMLRSRSLIRRVVDSTGFRLQISSAKSGAGTERSRSTFLTEVHVADNAPLGPYRLVPLSDDKLQLLEVDGKKLVDLVPVGKPVAARGLSFRASPAALAQAPLNLTVLPIDDAVDSVAAWTSVSRRSRDANIVDVRVRGADAGLVYAVANAFGQLYVVGHEGERRLEAQRSVEFLRDQLTRVSRQLRTSEQKLRDYRASAGVISLPDEASTGVSHRAELLAQRNATNVEREALQRLLQSTAGSKGGGADDNYRQLLAFPTLLRSDAAVGMQTALTMAEQKRSELVPQQTERGAEVKALDARIAELHGQLRAFVTTYLQGLTNEVQALDSTLSRSDRSLATLPEKELRYAELDRQAKTNESLFAMLQQRLRESEFAAAATDESIRLIDPAVLPRHPVFPRPILTTLLAIAAGLLIGVLGALLREYSDRALRTRSQLLALTGSPVLSLIPRLQGARAFVARFPGIASRTPAVPLEMPEQGRGAVVRPVGRGSSARYSTSDLFGFAESYARLVTNLGFAATERRIEVLLVTSALAGYGKTTVATNLALTLAREGKRVLLIDGDLRGGRIGGMLGPPARSGLGEALLRQITFDAAVAELDVGSERTLHVMPRGRAIMADPPALLASAAPRDLIAWARRRFNMVVIDTPPVNSLADAAMFSRHCDGVLLVARAGATGRDALVFAMEQLRMVRAPVVGAVLNDVDLRRDAGVDGAYAAYGRYASGSGARFSLQR
ncbi:MAG TPA: polysaccharide biosynthesis tyrosine autokinase [Gemmatimonadaceae bacterium]|nr:polysaccharide biosynthesis tyrosine autokinase [Gemmatimonadaceae bacterium]